MSIQKQLFEVKFRPSSIEQFVLPERIKEKFKNGIIEDNYLFHGTSGLGKSSLAKYFGDKMNMFYLNASRDGSVDNLRDGSELHDFCVTSSIMGDDKPKFVLLDELNGVSKQFFEGLKGFIDTYSELGIRFVGTTNYIEDIEPAILSRLKPISFNPTIEEEPIVRELYKKRVVAILNKIDTKYDDDSLEMLVEKNYPDWRGVLSDLQFLHRAGKKELTSDILRKELFQYKEIFDAVSKMNSSSDNEKIIELLRQFNNPSAVIKGLDRDMFKYYKENNSKMLFLVSDFSIILAKYCDMLNRRVDPTICLKALVFELIKKREISKI